MHRFRSSRLDCFPARFAQAESGSVAVEFAFVAVPFLTMMFALIELGMALLAYTSMETATLMASRRIRTGEFQEGGSNSKSDFKNLVCTNMSWLSSCSTDLYVDVRTFSSFGALGGNSPMPGPAFNPASTCFTAGAPTDIVLVRAYFKWRLFTPFLSGGLENMGAGSGMRLMSTATAFRNEPYSDVGPVGAKC